MLTERMTLLTTKLVILMKLIYQAEQRCTASLDFSLFNSRFVSCHINPASNVTSSSFPRKCAKMAASVHNPIPENNLSPPDRPQQKFRMGCSAFLKSSPHSFFIIVIFPPDNSVFTSDTMFLQMSSLLRFRILQLRLRPDLRMLSRQRNRKCPSDCRWEDECNEAVTVLCADCQLQNWPIFKFVRP